MSWTLVTGSAIGLGSAICLELAQKGHSLVIHYRESRKAAEDLQVQCQKFGVKAELIQGDLSNPDPFLEEYKTRFPDTKNLIHNVGNYHIGTLLDTPIDIWKELYQINFFSAVQMMQALAPSIIAQKGSIINIGVTGMQSVPADIYATAYTSTKLALWMATKSLAKELAGKGVRVNMISPGYLENAVDLPTNLSILPQGKPVTLEETARLVAFLLDEANASITGQNIEIAGAVRL